jgi:hypothetical protein
MLFAAVMHLDGLSLETLLTLKIDKFLISLVGTWRPTVSITEHQLMLPLKMLMSNKMRGFLLAYNTM